jgi:hypothetical protein
MIKKADRDALLANLKEAKQHAASMALAKLDAKEG